jgi:ATP-dependent Clp protease protease subunit
MRDYAKAKEVVSITPYDEIELEEIRERRLYINSIIDEEVVSGIVFYILKYNREDKGKDIKDRKPIILYINSPGGSVVDGYGLIDAILASKTPVYTVNQALAASMGFLIFLAGSRRFSMPHCQFLCHDGSTSGYDSSAKMRDRMEFETNFLNPMVKDYVISRTNIGPELYDEKYRVEWYMLSEEAKSHGIVTDIVGEDCDIDDII